MITALRTFATPRRWPAFARGMLAYGSAEGITRIVRLGAILIVARQISPAMLGTAALALSVFELVRVLTNVGIGQTIIKADPSQLGAICNAASRLFWIVCLAIAAIQAIIAGIAWLAFGMDTIAAMLGVLCAVYLFMPAGLVQIFLAMRAQRMGATAQVAATQNIADCALTVLLVLVWPSAWAIILPKVLTAPVWLITARRTHRWSYDHAIARAPLRAFAGFGPAVLASEMLIAARLHCDKLIVGAVLGTQALGLYYFAFNAGLGITQSLIAASNLVLFPHLANTPPEKIAEEFKRASVMGLGVLFPLVAAQALLAPFYVPIIFGDNWIAATPYLSLLACAALPLFVGALLGARHRALGQPYAEMRLMALATPAALIGLALGAQSGLLLACIGFAGGLAIVLLPAALRTLLFFPSSHPHLAQGGQ